MNLLKYPLSILTFILCTGFAQAEVAVIVAGNSTFAPISADEAVKIFLGKKKAISGTPILPVDQSEGAKARGDFYGNIVKKSESQLKSYWSRLIFTGKGQAPQVVGNDADVISMIATNPNLIGYIDAAAVNDSVKVIFKQ